MIKKLRGEFFILSANDLRTGHVVFMTKNGWSSNSDKATKIRINQIDEFQAISVRDEKKCIIVSSKFVELDEEGKIKSLRDKIRNSGLTFEIKNNV